MKVLFTICCALILSQLLLSSCSSEKVISSSIIQKKKYSKGYYLHFATNKNKKEVIKQDVSGIHKAINEELQYSESKIETTNPIIPSSVTPKRPYIKKITEIKFGKNPKKNIIPEDETEIPKKNSQLAKFSFILSIISTVIFLLSGINLKLILAMPFAALLAILLGGIALFQKILNPEKWKEHGFAIAGISIGLIEIWLFIKIFLV